MRKIIQLAAVALCVVALPVLAQEEIGQMPRMYVMYEEWVMPGMNVDYETGTKLLISKLSSDEMKDSGMLFFTMMEEDNLYTYVFPISSFSEIDKTAQIWSTVITSMRGEEVWGKRMSAVSASRYSIWMDATDLSYKPKNSRLKENEAVYAEHIMMKVIPGRETEFVNYARAIKALFEKHEITSGYSVYRCIVGEIGPAYLFVMDAKDPADYFTTWKDIMGKFGAEWMELGEKARGTYSSMDSGRGWFRPDLSHMPMPK